MYFYLSKLLAPLINFSNFIIIAILISLIFYLKFRNIFNKSVLIFFTSIFFIVVFFPIGNWGIIYLEKKFIIKNDYLKYDNIIVLAGSESSYMTNYTGRLDLNEASERLIASVDLALKNKNSRIIFLGGSGFLSNSGFNEINVAKMFYESVGFNLDRIKFVGSTRNTIENLKKFKELNINMKEDLLITSAFHMNRSLYISNKIGLNLKPYAVDFRQSSKKQELINLYQTFDVVGNLVKINIYFRELLGIIVTKLIL